LLAPPQASAPLTPLEAEVLKRYDKNGDGKLDEDELAQAHMQAFKDGARERLFRRLNRVSSRTTRPAK